MFKLSTSRELRWIVLPYGVKVEVKPLTTAVNQAALAEARKRVAVLAVEADEAAKTGQPLDALGPNGANAAWLDGMWTQFYAEALGRYGINRWDGIRGDDGEILPVSNEAIAAFAAHPDLGVAFQSAYAETLKASAAEGNVSTASVSGDTAAAKEPAETAPELPDGPAEPVAKPRAGNARQ